MPMSSDGVQADGVLQKATNLQEWRGFVYTKRTIVALTCRMILLSDGTEKPYQRPILGRRLRRTH